MLTLLRAINRRRWASASIAAFDLLRWLTAAPTAGYVYVLSCRDREYLKIGKSNDPWRRARELRGSGDAEPWRVEWARRFDDMDSAEHRAHRALAAYRVGERWPGSGAMPELFALSAEEAIAILRREFGT